MVVVVCCLANCQEYDWLLTIAAAWTVTVAVACMLLLQRLIHHNTPVRLCCGKPVSIGAAAFCFMSTEGASSVVLCTPVQHAVYGLLARHCVRVRSIVIVMFTQSAWLSCLVR